MNTHSLKKVTQMKWKKSKKFENDKSEASSKELMKRLIQISLPIMLITATLVILVLELSGYPGTLDDTQLGFSAEIIKTYFAMMKSEDMGLFVLGNLLDYGFMIAYGCFFYSSARYLAWDYHKGSLPLKIARIISLVGVLCAVSDAVENIFLLLMTTNPLDFPNWLAVAHSTFALLKFILMYLTIGWLIFSFVLNKIPLTSKKINKDISIELLK